MQKKEYRLNLRTKQCNVTDLDRPFRYIGIPPDAKFFFEAEVGAAGVPGESLVATNFYGKFPEDQGKQNYKWELHGHVFYVIVRNNPRQFRLCYFIIKYLG